MQARAEVERPTSRDRASQVLVVALTCVALALIAYLANRSQPRPPTIYGDDTWTLLAWRAHRLIDFRRAAYSSVGFALIVRLWLDVFGFSAGHARWLPLLFTMAAGPVFLIAALRMRIRYPAALLGAVVLVTSPEIVSMGTHVKQYSLDVLTSIAILGCAAAILRVPSSTRRWVTFMIVSVVALICSFAIVGVVVAGAIAGLLALVRQHGLRSRETARGLAFSALVGAFALAWYVFALQPIIPAAALNRFWKGFFFGSYGGWTQARYLFTFFFNSAFGTPLFISAVIFLVATVVVAVRRPLHAVLFGTPPLIAIVASLAQQAPFGAGRTDIWFYAPTIFMVISAVDIVLERSGGMRPAVARVGEGVVTLIAVALVVVFVGRGYPGGPDTYGEGVFRFQTYEVPLIEKLEGSRGPGDLVVLGGRYTFSYALYGRGSMVTEPTSWNVTGFLPRLRGVDAVYLADHNQSDVIDVLRRRLDGVTDVWTLDDSSSALRPKVDALLRQHGFVPTRTEHLGTSLVHWQTATG